MWELVEITLFHSLNSTHEQSRNSIAGVYRPNQHNAIHPALMICSKTTSDNTTYRVADNCHPVLDIQCVEQADDVFHDAINGLFGFAEF